VVGDADGDPQPFVQFLDVRRLVAPIGQVPDDGAQPHPPQLDEPGLAEDAGERRIALDGHAVGDLLNGHAGHEPAGALDDDGPVVEDHLDGGAAVGVAGVDEGVDDQFADRGLRDGGDVPAPPVPLRVARPEFGPQEPMALQEGHDLVDGEGERTAHIRLVDEVEPVAAAESAALHPRVGEEALRTGAGDEQARVGRAQTPVLASDQFQGEQFLLSDGPAEKPFQHQRVDVVDIGLRVDLPIEGPRARPPGEIVRQQPGGPPVGGAEAYIGAAVSARLLQIIWALPPDRHVGDEYGPAIEGDEFDGGKQLGAYRVRNEIGQSHLGRHGIIDADDAAIIRHADDEAPARRIGEGHDCAQHSLGSGQIELVVQGLALVVGDSTVGVESQKVIHRSPHTPLWSVSCGRQLNSYDPHHDYNIEFFSSEGSRDEPGMKDSPSLSHRKNPRAGPNRRDCVRGPGTTQGGAAPCAPPPLRHPSFPHYHADHRPPAPPVLVRKAHYPYGCRTRPADPGEE